MPAVTAIKVLHLLSDWKWTGPSEPVVLLCRALRELGMAVDFIHMPRPACMEGGIPDKAADLEPKTFLRLRKSPNMLWNALDVLKLARHIDATGIDVVHTHSTHDHMVGGWAAQLSRRRPPVVRTHHAGRPIEKGFWSRSLYALADGLIEISEQARATDARVFRFPEKHTLTVEGCIPMDRFASRGDLKDARPEFGLSGKHIVAGIVARVQRHRRFKVLLEAWQLAMAAEPRLRGMVVGRGTHIEAVAKAPARAMGIDDRIAFTGYRKGDDYLSALAAMDFLIFLMPGSDGSCRAVREAMAMGVPIIAARRGLLPELVEDGRCGLVIDDTPQGLADAMLKLGADADLRRRLGRNAAEKADAEFRIEKQARRMLRFYAGLPCRTKGYLSRRSGGHTA